MPTVVKTIGTNVRDFSTLAAWAASLPANLVTDGNSYEGDCYNDSEFNSASTLLTLSGHTTDATHTITLTTGAGQSFRDNANAQTNALRYNQSNGVGINCTGSYNVAISVSDDNVFIKGLQATGNPAGTQSWAFNVASGSHVITIDDCIFEGTDGGGVNGVVSLTGSSCKIRNSLIVHRKASGVNVLLLDNGAAAYNCTIVVPSNITSATNGIKIAYTGQVVENCAVFGATTAISATTGVTITTCFTDQATPPTGFTQTTYSTSAGAKFQNITDATRDYRIQSGSSLIDVGTTDSTNGTPDIVKTTRPQGSAYDVGAWEFLSAAPAASPKRALMGVGV